MKILLVRFSSIGDIVLTTPIIRALKQQLKQVEIHYITKQSFASVLENNPYIDRLITVKKSLSEVMPILKKEEYDYIIDLHHNVRTLKLKMALGKKSLSFNKLNWQKFLIVTFKINTLPQQHIVDRYFETVKPLGVYNDNKGLDYFITEKDIVNINHTLAPHFQKGYHALVIGGSYFTKRIPLNKLKEICAQSTLPLVLLGGKEDHEIAEQLCTAFKETTANFCGHLTLNQSASLIQQAQTVISSDTGLMHIAAAYKKRIISLWGNTISEFGMGPYLADVESKILQVDNLSCRPCSKLGSKKCPKGHFKCMNEIDITSVNF